MLFQLEYLSNIPSKLFFFKNHSIACSCDKRQQMAFDLGRAERENVSHHSHDCKEISGEGTPPPM